MKTRPCKSRNGPTALRLIVWASLSVLLASNLVGLVHMASVRHMRCVERGELTHIDSKHVGPPVALAFSQLLTGRTELHKPLSSDTSEYAYDRCAVAAVCRNHGAAAPVIDMCVDVAFVPAEVPPPYAGEAWCAVAVYIVAPKHSPPTGLA